MCVAVCAGRRLSAAGPTWAGGGGLQIRLGRGFTVTMERVPHGGVEDLLEAPPLDNSRARLPRASRTPTPVLNKGHCKPERRRPRQPPPAFPRHGATATEEPPDMALDRGPSRPGAGPAWLRKRRDL